MVAVRTTIDPNAPLFDGYEQLRAAAAEATRLVPVAPAIAKTGGIKRASGFRRAVTNTRTPVGAHRRTLQPRQPEQMEASRKPGVQGSTRYWRTNDVSQAFSLRSANSNNNNLRASALLFSSSMQRSPQTGPWGVQISTPKAQYLDALNRKAQAVKAYNTLSKRFNDNRADMADGRGDMERTYRAQQLGYTAGMVMVM